MRELTRHKVNGLNDAIIINVIDEPGAGGANHQYEFHYADNDGDAVYQHIHFQEGAIGENGINGISNEAVLAVVEDRLNSFQEGPFACRENASALTNVREAMDWLRRRTTDRCLRGVEGTTVLALFLCLFIGCDTLVGPKKPVVIDIPAPPFNDDADIWAVAEAKVVNVNGGGNVVPSPVDACPKVGDVCPNFTGNPGDRCKSGDGINVDSFCGGDGKMDAGDRGIVDCVHSPPQETPEHSIIKETVAKEDFEFTVDILKAANEMVLKRVDENVLKVNGLIDELNTTMEEDEEEEKALIARVNELEAMLKALDERCTCGKETPPSTTEKSDVTTQYQIDYQGYTYVWDEASRSFVGPGSRRVTFPHLGPIEEQAVVQICYGPQGSQTCERVTVYTVQRTPVKVTPKTVTQPNANESTKAPVADEVK